MLLEFYVHDESLVGGLIDLKRLQNGSDEAFPLCLEKPGLHESALQSLKTIEINLVSDPVIADVHGQFMDDPTPTDVITFQHGEVFVSTDTAARVSRDHDHPPSREALLYIVHALLHLNGHHDQIPAERSEMHAIQDSILQKIWPFPES
ncbi:MAG: rRNA maturation RNase YbeY [Verrucomicrobiales bacterium]|nr:rRNA maturation RNase YbeY [Verrucomicrobiales bacterium]